MTGIPDSQVMLHDGENDSVVTDDSCQIRPTWNASVCTGDIGRLNLSDARGELPPQSIWNPAPPRFALLSSLGPNAPDTPLVKAQRAALFSRRAPEAPIALVRNGKEFKISGDQSTVRAGTEIEVKTERPKVTLSLAEMNQGSWVIFELPGFTKAASGTEKGSMDALRRANEDCLFQGRGCPLGQTGGRCSGQAGHSSNGSASQYSGQQIRTPSQPPHPQRDGDQPEPVLRWREEIASRQASGHERLPLGQGGRAAGLVGRAADEMAFEVDVIVDVSAFFPDIPPDAEDVQKAAIASSR